jgi:hypothetical protein
MAKKKEETERPVCAQAREDWTLNIKQSLKTFLLCLSLLGAGLSVSVAQDFQKEIRAYKKNGLCDCFA